MALVDGKTRLQIAGPEEVVELGAPLVEFRDVGGGEIAARRIKELEVALVDFLRAGIVQRRFAVMMPLEQFDDIEAGDHLLAVGLQGGPIARAGGLGGRRQEAAAEG
ncbi:hypothetical protein D3C77_503290 [compost metagenome]